MASLLRAATLAGRGPGDPTGFLDDAPRLAGKVLAGLPVLGGFSWLEGVGRNGVRAVLGMGMPPDKHRALARVESLVSQWPAAVHPHAVVGGEVTMGRGVHVQAGCVLTTDIVIDDFVTLNVGVSLNHDVRIGRLATLSPRVCVGGGVAVEEGAFLGIGATVIQGVRVGSWSIVGAGAVVLEDVPPNAVVVGVPARVLRTRTPGWQDHV